MNEIKRAIKLLREALINDMDVRMETLELNDDPAGTLFGDAVVAEELLAKIAHRYNVKFKKCHFDKLLEKYPDELNNPKGIENNYDEDDE